MQSRTAANTPTARTSSGKAVDVLPQNLPREPMPFRRSPSRSRNSGVRTVSTVLPPFAYGKRTKHRLQHTYRISKSNRTSEQPSNRILVCPGDADQAVFFCAAAQPATTAEKTGLVPQWTRRIHFHTVPNPRFQVLAIRLADSASAVRIRCILAGERCRLLDRDR